MDDTRIGESPRRLTFQVAAIALTVVSAFACTGLAYWLRNPGDGVPEAPAVNFPNRLFAGWKKPDLVLVMTGQMNGYVLPCGCSEPQMGGLERRYNFLEKIKEHGWPYVAIDLGDLVQRHAPAHLPNQQALIKYSYSMKALEKMGYSAVAVGEAEVNQGLLTVLAEYALQSQKPRVVIGNLIDAEKNFPEMTAPLQVVDSARTGINVGVTSIVGPSVAARIKELSHGDNTVRFEQTTDAMNSVLKGMAAKRVHLPVLLYQGPITRSGQQKPWTEAMACAEAYPEVPVTVCLGEDDDPLAKPMEVVNKAGGKSLIVTVGRKGKWVVVVGVYKTGKQRQPFDFRYERVEMTPDFKTAEGKDKGHPIVQLMEEYTQALKDQKYLEKYGQVRHNLQIMDAVPGLAKNVPVTYAGSDACKKCHKKAHDVWAKTPHSHAYQALVDAKRPGNRQYDPECIVCHTVGFGYLSGFINEQRTPTLKDVGCESCHGPSSMHVANQYDPEWQKRINPWKHLEGDKRKEAIDAMCQKCHDIDNDVTWKHGGFERKWPGVKHYEGPDPKLEEVKKEATK